MCWYHMACFVEHACTHARTYIRPLRTRHRWWAATTTAVTSNHTAPHGSFYLTLRVCCSILKGRGKGARGRRQQAPSISMDGQQIFDAAVIIRRYRRRRCRRRRHLQKEERKTLRWCRGNVMRVQQRLYRCFCCFCYPYENSDRRFTRLGGESREYSDTIYYQLEWSGRRRRASNGVSGSSTSWVRTTGSFTPPPSWFVRQFFRCRSGLSVHNHFSFSFNFCFTIGYLWTDTWSATSSGSCPDFLTASASNLSAYLIPA